MTKNSKKISNFQKKIQIFFDRYFTSKTFYFPFPGILLGLMSDELEFETLAKLPKVSRHILTDSSFQIACLEFALGEIRSTVLVPTDQPRGNFDPKLNRFVDPLTNEIRKIPSHRLLNERTMKNDPPILKFDLSDCEY